MAEIHQLDFRRPQETDPVLQEPLIIHKHRAVDAESIVILVHGWGGSRYTTWGSTPKFLFEDLPSVDIGLYDYVSGPRRARFTRSVSFDVQTQHLASTIRSLRQYRRVILMGHSLGGLLCQYAIVDLLESMVPTDDTDVPAVHRVAGLFLIGAPQAGTRLVLPGFGWLTTDLQVLRQGSSTVQRIVRTFANRVVTHGAPNGKLFIPTFAVVGGQDWVVDGFSARLALPDAHTKPVMRDHRGVAKPKHKEEEAYVWVRSRLSEQLESRHQPDERGRQVHGSGLLPQNQLPPDIAHFVGRDELCSELSRLARRVAVDNHPYTVLISTIEGVPGVGKTALAVHWCHSNQSLFPDGIIYVNLRSYDSQPPAELESTLDDLLRGLGVPAAEFPKTLDAKSALLRSTLRGGRRIIVIDNANSADQVRRFLPNSGGSLVLVTSRNTLPGMAIREGAKTLQVPLMTESEALELLEDVVGRERVRSEYESAQQLVSRCHRLPLALRIVAKKLQDDPDMTIISLVKELREDRSLRKLRLAGDPDSSVETVFSWTYRTLPAQQARAFRLLANSFVADFTVLSAAALLGAGENEAGAILGELENHYLVESVGGRYGFHDLLKSYAESLTDMRDSDEGSQAERRLLEWFLASALAADSWLAPRRRQVRAQLSETRIPAIPLDSHRAALSWFEAEHVNLVRAVHTAFGLAQWEAAWRIPMAMRAYFQLCKAWPEWIDTHEVSLRAIEQMSSGADAAAGWVLSSLGNAKFDLGIHREALEHHEKALAAWTGAGDLWGKGQTLISVGNSQRALGMYEASLASLVSAREISAEQDNMHGVALALTNLAETNNARGDFAAAIPDGEHALELWRSLDNTWGEALALRCLGFAFTGNGEHEKAQQSFDNALISCREINDRKHEAEVLYGLGKLAAAAFDEAEASVLIGEAAHILEKLDDHRAAAYRREAEDLRNRTA